MFIILISSIFTAIPFSEAPIIPTTSIYNNRATISGEELRTWYKEKKPMIVLDARSIKSGPMLPRAKSLPPSSSDKRISTVLPNKNSLIVVYCANAKCPKARQLYDKLRSMGYQNLYEYREGISDWIQRGYSVTK